MGVLTNSITGRCTGIIAIKNKYRCHPIKGAVKKKEAVFIG
jgi:hypothetical protein